jgi:tetratricopeptide (TPR) repeat protein
MRPPATTAAAVDLLDCYLVTAAGGDLALNRYRWHHHEELYADAQGYVPADRATALGWWDREHRLVLGLANLCQSIGRHESALALAETCLGWLEHSRDMVMWQEVVGVALDAASRTGHPADQAYSLIMKARYLTVRHDFDTADRAAGESLHIWRALGHVQGQATATEMRGVAAMGAQRGSDAVKEFTESLRLHEQLGRPRACGLQRRQLAGALAQVGRSEEALAETVRAEEILREVGDGALLGHLLVERGGILLSLGRPVEAEAAVDAGMALAESPYRQAVGRMVLARIYHQTDRTDAAQLALRRAHHAFVEAGVPEARQAAQMIKEIRG